MKPHGLQNHWWKQTACGLSSCSSCRFCCQACPCWPSGSPTPDSRLRKAILWVAGLALLASCAVAIFSIGLFYLPAALALLCAAAASTLERPREAIGTI